MAYSAESLLHLPRIQEQKEVSLNLFPGMKSNTFGGPTRRMKLRKRLPVIVLKEDKLVTVAGKINGLIKHAQFDYRISEIQKLVEEVSPLLLQQSRRDAKQTLSSDELASLRQIMAVGTAFVKNGKKLNRLNRKLADAIVSLGNALQGFDV